MSGDYTVAKDSYTNWPFTVGLKLFLPLKPEDQKVPLRRLFLSEHGPSGPPWSSAPFVQSSVIEYTNVTQHTKQVSYNYIVENIPFATRNCLEKSSFNLTNVVAFSSEFMGLLLCTHFSYKAELFLSAFLLRRK